MNERTNEKNDEEEEEEGKNAANHNGHITSNTHKLFIIYWFCIWFPIDADDDDNNDALWIALEYT